MAMKCLRIVSWNQYFCQKYFIIMFIPWKLPEKCIWKLFYCKNIPCSLWMWLHLKKFQAAKITSIFLNHFHGLSSFKGSAVNYPGSYTFLIILENHVFMVSHFRISFPGFELGKKSWFTKKLKQKKEKKLLTVKKLYVHTVINKTFFRYKVCIQAWIFIDRNDQLGVSVGK